MSSKLKIMDKKPIAETILEARRESHIRGENPDVISISLLDLRRVWRWLSSQSMYSNPYMPASFRGFLQELKFREVRLFGMTVEVRLGLEKPMARGGLTTS